MIPSRPLSRRTFLQGLGVAGLGIASVPAGGLGAADAARKPKPRWRVASRDVYLKYAKAPDAWQAMKQLGVSGVEVEVAPDFGCRQLHHPSKRYGLGKPADVTALRDDLRAQGLAITAFCMHNRFDERLEEELAGCERIIAACRILGVKVIRIDMVPRKIKREAYLPFAIATGKKLCALSRGSGVRYGIENHGSTTNDPVFLKRLFEGVESMDLGMTLDPSNLYWYGHPLRDVYRICQDLAPRTYHTHTKSIRYPADRKETKRPMGWEYRAYSRPIYDGDLDYPRIVTILREAGYANDLCLENESLHHFPPAEQAAVLKREIAMLHTLVRPVPNAADAKHKGIPG